MCLSLKTLCVWMCVGASLSGCYGQRRENPDEWNHATTHTHNIYYVTITQLLCSWLLCELPPFGWLVAAAACVCVCIDVILNAANISFQPVSTFTRTLQQQQQQQQRIELKLLCLLYSCTLFLFFSCSFFDVLVHRDLIVIYREKMRNNTSLFVWFCFRTKKYLYY